MKQRLGFLLLGSALAIAGCVTPATPDWGSSTASGTAYRSEARPGDTAPTWRSMPLSWEKLEAIEEWRARVGGSADPSLLLEAELELASGRLALSRSERDRVPGNVLALRLDLAEAGFRRVLTSPRAGTRERNRAEAGLTELAALRGGGEPLVAQGGGLTILPRSSWGARAPHPSDLKANRRPWTNITVHHSATSGNGAGAIRLVQKDHMESRGYGDIGYHFLIDSSGRIYQGRSLRWQGAHAGGKDGINNVGNIGICLLGDFDQSRPDPRALRSLEQLIGGLSQRHGIARSRVKGHQQYKATECPGEHLMAWVKRYRGSASAPSSAQ